MSENNTNFVTNTDQAAAVPQAEFSPAEPSQAENQPQTAAVQSQAPQPETNEMGLSQNEFLAQDSAAITSTTGLNLWDRFVLATNFSWPKLVAIVLTFQGLIGIYSSIRFIFIEYPKLDFLFEHHMLAQEELNIFTSKAFITVLSTVVDMFFAFRISIISHGLTKKIETIIGSIFFLASTAITKIFGVVDAGNILDRLLQLFLP